MHKINVYFIELHVVPIRYNLVYHLVKKKFHLIITRYYQSNYHNYIIKNIFRCVLSANLGNYVWSIQTC